MNQQHPALVATQKWLEDIVIGLNFCPFAKKEFINGTIHYEISTAGQLDKALEVIAEQCQKLMENDDIETTLVIYSLGFRRFEQYLDLVEYANDLLIEFGFEGDIQIASFHPDYVFDGEDEHSPSHYTNRSPYPTIHLIREASMEKVLSVYKDPELIPENNIALTEEKGAAFFRQYLAKIKKM
ncbi:DUF1415 domain-containing protein [Thalassotalea euphylliae]|uniref:DUF1415 domain-containing protein n=1 Tax=Thalassotalea euphylliae TaxID=1655234 RepID=UPI00363105DD